MAQDPRHRAVVYLTPDQRKRIKIYAAERETTVTEILRSHILDLIGERPRQDAATSADRT